MSIATISICIHRNFTIAQVHLLELELLSCRYDNFKTEGVVCLSYQLMMAFTLEICQIFTKRANFLNTLTTHTHYMYVDALVASIDSPYFPCPTHIIH
jgi:hypothetical protein